MEKTDSDAILEIKKLLKIDKGINNFLKKCFNGGIDNTFGSILNITGQLGAGKTLFATQLAQYFIKNDFSCSIFSTQPLPLTTYLKNQEKLKTIKIYKINSSPALKCSFENVFNLINNDCKKNKTQVIILDSIDDLYSKQSLKHNLNQIVSCSVLKFLSNSVRIVRKEKILLIITNKLRSTLVQSPKNHYAARTAMSYF